VSISDYNDQRARERAEQEDIDLSEDLEEENDTGWGISDSATFLEPTDD
jgi:hypothetical protein